MAVLTGDYQYIGRSSAVSCSAGWNYYILLYAKTSGNISTGKHTVTVLMRLACTSDSTFYGYRTDGSVTVAGTNAIAWSNAQRPATGWGGAITVGGVYYYRHTDLGEGSVEVNTGWGAAKDISIATSWGRVESVNSVPSWLPYYKTYATANITVTLPMIAGASTINWAGNVTLGNACSVNWTPIGAALRYKLRFALGNWSYTTGVIHPNTTSGYTYTGYGIPLDVANQIPASPTGTMAVTLYTYSDSGGTAQLGSAHTAYFTVTVPDNASTKPGVGFSQLAPNSNLAAPFNGLYIKGKSRVYAEVAAYGRYGAYITEISFTVDGKTYGNGATSEYLNNAGNLTVVANVRDSRGFYNSYSTGITVHDYAKPTIQVSTCARSDASGNISDSGTSLKIAAQRSIFSVGGNNSCRMWYQWKLATAPDSGFSNQITLTSGDSYSGVITDVVFNKQASYVIRIGVTDGVGETVIAVFTILTEKIYWHRGNDFLALGMYTQNGGFECAWPARFYGPVYIGTQSLAEYIQNLMNGGG